SVMTRASAKSLRDRATEMPSESLASSSSLGETKPAGTAFAEYDIPTLTVASTNSGETAAEAALFVQSSANGPAGSVNRRRFSRFRSISRARDNRSDIDPLGQPSWAAAWAFVCPHR